MCSSPGDGVLAALAAELDAVAAIDPHAATDGELLALTRALVAAQNRLGLDNSALLCERHSHPVYPPRLPRRTRLHRATRPPMAHLAPDGTEILIHPLAA